MKQLFLPEDYTSVLDVWQTEHAIKFIKDTFQLALAAELKLRRITAPIVVPSGKGLNDNLSGTEQPVSFGARVLGGQRADRTIAGQMETLCSLAASYSAGYGNLYRYERFTSG